MMQSVFITGSTDGIGRVVAIELSKKGYNVVVHGKDKEKIQSCVREIENFLPKGACGIEADLSCLKNVEKIVDYIKNNPIDILINNAGIYAKEYKLSCDGFELTFVINYLSHFYLTMLLMQRNILPKVILNISSMIHANYIDFDDLIKPKEYDANEAYSVSKLCNIMFTYYFDKEFKHKGSLINALHPGVINTKMLVNNWGAIGDSVDKGAQNVINTLDFILKNNVSAAYFVSGLPTQSKKISYNEEIQKRLWEMSLKLCKINLD